MSGTSNQAVPLSGMQAALTVQVRLSRVWRRFDCVEFERFSGSINVFSFVLAEEEPLPSANYIEAGSELKVKIEVGCPLATAAEVRRRVVEPDKVDIPLEV